MAPSLVYYGLIRALLSLTLDTSDFVLKSKYNTDNAELEKKIPDTSDLVKKIIIILKLLN